MSGFLFSIASGFEVEFFKFLRTTMKSDLVTDSMFLKIRYYSYKKFKIVYLNVVSMCFEYCFMLNLFYK